MHNVRDADDVGSNNENHIYNIYIIRYDETLLLMIKIIAILTNIPKIIMIIILIYNTLYNTIMHFTLIFRYYYNLVRFKLVY